MEPKINILIIDDEPSVVDALKMILRDHGFDAAIALTGQAGLEQIEKQPFALTVTDLRLPDMTGLDVLTRIREKNPKGLVILISAYVTPDTVAHAFRLGAVDILPKPFSPARFIEVISSILSSRQ